MPMKRRWGWTFSDSKNGYSSYGDCLRWAALCREAGWLTEARILIVAPRRKCTDCGDIH